MSRVDATVQCRSSPLASARPHCQALVLAATRSLVQPPRYRYLFLVVPFGGFDRELGEFPSPFETSEERFGVRLIGEEDIPHSGLGRDRKQSRTGKTNVNMFWKD
jgi:hypothetical protein